MPLTTHDADVLEGALAWTFRRLDTDPPDPKSFFGVLGSYEGGDDELVLRALTMLGHEPFASSPLLEEALEHLVGQASDAEVRRAASDALVARWRAFNEAGTLPSRSLNRARRMARSFEGAPLGWRFVWAWTAGPKGLPIAVRLVREHTLGADALEPILDDLLSGTLDDGTVELIDALLEHSSWIARRVLLNQIGGPDHIPLLPALARTSTSADPTTQLALVGAFRRIGHPAAEHPLLALLRAPGPSPDVALIDALGELGTPNSLPTLHALAQSSDAAPTRAPAAAAVDAIVARAATEGGGLTLVAAGGLDGALSPAGAPAGALSEPGGGEPNGSTRAGAGPSEASRDEPASSLTVTDAIHENVLARLHDAASDAPSTDLALRSWFGLAPAPRRAPRFVGLIGSPPLVLITSAIGIMLLLLVFVPLSIIFVAPFLFYGVPVLLVTLIARWSFIVSRPLRRARLMRRGIPILGERGHYDSRHGAYPISFLTDDNRRVDTMAHVLQSDPRFARALQPLLYDPETDEVEPFALIEGVEVGADGHLTVRPAAAFYRNVSVALLCAGVISLLFL